MLTSTLVGIPLPVKPPNLFPPRKTGYQARCSYPSLRCPPGIWSRHHTNVCPLFIPRQLDSPTFCAGKLDDPPGGLSETLDQLQIWMDISKHLPGDTFTQTVKGRIRDQHPLPGWELWDERLWFKGCIYVPEPLCLQLIRNHQDHPMAGHFRHHKPIHFTRRSFHLPGLTMEYNNATKACLA